MGLRAGGDACGQGVTTAPIEEANCQLDLDTEREPLTTPWAPSATPGRTPTHPVRRGVERRPQVERSRTSARNAHARTQRRGLGARRHRRPRGGGPSALASGHPPHRSERAELPHSAPTSSSKFQGRPRRDRSDSTNVGSSDAGRRALDREGAHEASDVATADAPLDAGVRSATDNAPPRVARSSTRSVSSAPRRRFESARAGAGAATRRNARRRRAT